VCSTRSNDDCLWARQVDLKLTIPALSQPVAATAWSHGRCCKTILPLQSPCRLQQPRCQALPQEPASLTEKAISLNMAQAMVQGAIEKYPADNYHVSVQVIDADGQLKASVRDDRSSDVNYDVSCRKAYTALTYKRPSRPTWKRRGRLCLPHAGSSSIHGQVGTVR
jgi:hypothetical protein